ncbi:MAG: hybrid sensor histidine kinase/response regulator [Candidatus Sumerlaeaceae bacterium]
MNAPESTHLPAPEARRILVVDARASTRTQLGGMLQSQGFSVIEASDGVEALQVLSNQAVNAVISAILMPRIDGYQLLRRIRATESLWRLPVLIYTSVFATAEDVELAFKLGADEVLERPVPDATIVAVLQRFFTDPLYLRERSGQKSSPTDLREFTVDYSTRLVGKLVEKSEGLLAAQNGLNLLNKMLVAQAAQLRESEQRFRQLAEHIREVFWVATCEPLAFSYISPAWEHTWGMGASDSVVDMEDWLDRIHSEDRQRVRKAIENRAVSGAYEQEYRIVRPDGTIIFIFDRGFPVSGSSPSCQRFVGIAEDITRQKQVTEQLVESREELRALAIKLQYAREAEREAIAREIHDQLGQQLTGFQMDLQWILKRLQPDQKELSEKVRSMVALVDQTVETVQKLSFDMRPSILDDLGLISTIEWQAAEFQKRTEIRCVMKKNLSELSLTSDLSTAIFRILEECLTNVARHSRATQAEITLTKKHQKFVMEIRDNGVGIQDPSLMQRPSLGLLGMRERAAAFGGKIEFNRIPSGGTKVLLTMPI